jgi:hypothetical protein
VLGVGAEDGREAQTPGLVRPLLRPGRSTDLARQADLPDRGEGVRVRAVPRGTRESEHDRQVCARFGELHPAHRRHVDVRVRQLDAGSAFQHREEHRDPRCVDAVDDPPRLRRRARDDERLDLHRQGPTPFHRHGDARARHRCPVAGHEQAAGVGDLVDAVTGHVEAADLVGGAEPVLQGADEAQGGLPVTLEVADDVDQVFEQSGAGDRAVLRDVSDDEDGECRLLGDPDEGGGDLAHL